MFSFLIVQILKCNRKWLRKMIKMKVWLECHVPRRVFLCARENSYIVVWLSLIVDFIFSCFFVVMISAHRSNWIPVDKTARSFIAVLNIHFHLIFRAFILWCYLNLIACVERKYHSGLWANHRYFGHDFLRLKEKIMWNANVFQANHMNKWN